jgi:hypothetical protein
LIARQPAPGETNELVAQKSEEGIPSAVLLERRAGSVCVPAIDFDDQALFGPGEIDEAADPNIHLRLGKAVAATERKETSLQLAARAIQLERVPEREPEKLGLS